MSEAPRKALRLTLTIDAHDDDDLTKILDQFALDTARGQISLTSGVSSAGWSYTVTRDPKPLTREQYESQIMEWFDARKAERASA